MTSLAESRKVGDCRACSIPMIGEFRWKNGYRPEGYRVHAGRGLCSACYRRSRRPRPAPRAALPCKAEGCDRVRHAQGYCMRHYRIKRADGTLGITQQQIPGDEVLEDWVMVRGAVSNLEEGADRLGMSVPALEMALYRARQKGDPRGNVPLGMSAWRSQVGRKS